MSGIRRVTGLGFDGSTVTSTIGRLQIRTIKAAYGDKLETSFTPAMGAQDQGEQSPGAYKTDPLKLTMTAVVFRRDFMPLCSKTGFGLRMMPIIIGRTHPDIGSDSDLLDNCRIMNLAAAIEASNKIEEVPIEFSIGQIFWTDQRKTINALNGAVPTGASGF